ncbi:MAG: hypothetical protein IJD77_04115 [Clostridia bacterium]|nr:hypothetical protein [Clostridia bacterium]
MNKKTCKITTVLLSLLMAMCLLFGIVFVKNDDRVVGSAELVTSTKWSNPTTNANLTAKEDTETGYTHLNAMNAWGDRLYYNEKLTLDGLTVTIGSTNMVANSRFGFGFTNDAGGYTPQSGPFNVTVVPSQYSGQDSVYFNSTHADGTIVYLTGTTTAGVCNVDGSVQNRFVSATSTETRYSITFTYKGAHPQGYGNYWSATITLDKGNAFRTGLTSATVDFLDSSLNGILDSNGQCYLSAFGMPGEFYMNIITAEEKALLVAADSALSAYQTKKTSSATASVVTEREAAVAAIANVPEKYQSSYQAQLLAIDQIDNTWVPAFNTCAAATYDTDTMYSNLTPKDYGNRIYYYEKVKLDGLTVTIGSSNMVAGSRFGFGFTNVADGYTPESGPFNVTVVPSEYEGQNSVYFNSTHASGTIVYLTDTVTAGVCTVNDSVQNRFVSATSAETRYSVTFTYRGAHPGGFGNYWTAKITLDEGNPFVAGLTSATVDFLDASLNGILDGEGKCYISAFGMGSAGGFYMGIKESADNTMYADADAALEAYRQAIIKGEDSTAAKEAYDNAISSLPANQYVSYVAKGTELEELEETLASVQQSVSVTVSDTLSWNYKIDVPEGIEISRTVLTSEMRGKTEEYTTGIIDDQGRFVVTTQNITPQYLTEAVNMKFEAYDVDGNKVITREINYTIKEYCEELLRQSDDRKLRSALVDMLNYGAEAQKYVNANTETLANMGVSSYQGLATGFNASGATNRLAVNQGSVVTFTAASLFLEDKVSVYAKFSTTVDVSTLTAQAQIGSNAAVNLEIQEGGNGVYCVVLPGISPLQYADDIIFSISYNGSVDAQCRYSVNSYVARKYNDAKCGAIVKALYSYGAGVSAYATAASDTDTVQTIADTFYKNGLSIISPDGSTTTTATTVNDGTTPSWIVAQWESVGSLNNTSEENGVFTYWDAAKMLSIDTNTGAIAMDMKGSVEYPTQDRQAIEDPWPHLVMQQDYYGDQLIHLSEMESVNMQMKYTVTKCEDKMHGAVNADDLHCAQFVWYITLQNRTEGHEDFGKYMWFGMVLFDNRYQGAVYERTNKTADNSDQFIYQPGTADWSPTGTMATLNETMTIDFNILDVAKVAYNEATKWSRWDQVFSSTTWEDLYVGSMNFGIEIPGTYDMSVDIEHVGIASVPKA